MHSSEILGLKDQAVQSVVRKQLREDPVKLEKLISSFKEWLGSESYLPEISDQNFISNYVRHCKYDLEQAKKKFEDWLLARYRLKDFIVKSWNYDYFDDIKLERTIIYCPKLTPEGYRVGFARIPGDVTDFNFQKFFNYGLVIMEFLVYKDESAGIIAIYDFNHLTKKHFDKVDVKLLSETINWIYNIFPVKLVQNHFINVPYIPENLISIAKRVVNEDVIKTVTIHKEPVDLTQYVPKDCLPIEYGGNPNIKINEIAEKQKKYIMEDTEFARQRESLQFVGGLPQHKRQQYSLE